MVVLVDQSAAGGTSSDRLAGPIFDDGAVVGCSLAETAARSVGVVVLDVVAQELSQLSTAPDEGAVAQFAAHGADPPFRVRVGDGCVGRGADDRRAVAAEELIERSDELSGAVADQESGVAGRSACGGCGRLGLSTGRSGWW